MIWLTWRQFRAQSFAAVAALAVLAVIYGVTGSRLAHLYATSGLATCHAHGDCSALSSSFLTAMKSDSLYPLLFFLGLGALYLAPAIIGIFWGAPLVTREFEAGTFRLAWNQSVTRTRWMAVKLGLIGLAAIAAAGLLSLMITWWAGPIDAAGGFPASMNQQVSRFSTVLFGARGIAPIGYAALAFALGVTAGVLIRRTLPAMAITLAVFAVIQLAWPNWVRPHLIPPVHATAAVAVNLNDAIVTHNGEMIVPVTRLPGAWIISNQTITTSGHLFVLPATGPCAGGAPPACNAWLATQHLRRAIAYQPASRFWAFQWYETAIYLALAFALAGFCIWWVRHRRLS
jgi:ABC-type transport system involved in multi-copper enzyme maturation permease subunit